MLFAVVDDDDSKDDAAAAAAGAATTTATTTMLPCCYWFLKANEWPSPVRHPLDVPSHSSIGCNFAYYSHDGFRFASFCRFCVWAWATSSPLNVERRTSICDRWKLKCWTVERSPCSGSPKCWQSRKRRQQQLGDAARADRSDLISRSELIRELGFSLFSFCGAKYRWLRCKWSIPRSIHPSSSIHKSITWISGWEPQLCPLSINWFAKQRAGSSEIPPLILRAP